LVAEPVPLPTKVVVEMEQWAIPLVHIPTTVMLWVLVAHPIPVVVKVAAQAEALTMPTQTAQAGQVLADQVWLYSVYQLPITLAHIQVPMLLSQPQDQIPYCHFTVQEHTQHESLCKNSKWNSH
jgi:hypothetical protein